MEPKCQKMQLGCHVTLNLVTTRTLNKAVIGRLCSIRQSGLAATIGAIMGFESVSHYPAMGTALMSRSPSQAIAAVAPA